jgi:hypothetical protein
MEPQQQEAMDRLGAKILALASDAGVAGLPQAPLATMDSLDVMDGYLDRLRESSRSLKEKVQRVKAGAERAKRLLDRPKAVADALKSLSGDLATLSNLLQIAKVIRVVRPLADRVRGQVDRLRRLVDDAEGKALGLDRRVQPFREALDKLIRALDQLVQRLDQLGGHVDSFRTKLRSTRACMEALPAGPVRDRGFALLNDFARSVNMPLGFLADSVAGADAQTTALIADLQTLERLLEQVRSGVLEGIASVRGVFGPLLDPLKEVAKVLDYKIDIKIFSFSLREILEGLSLPWPFSYLEDAFWELANSILEPILRTLHLDISLPGIPALDLVGQINLDVPHLLDLERAVQNLEGLFPLVQGLVDRFKVDCPPAAGAPFFTDQLLAELAGAKPKLTTS